MSYKLTGNIRYREHSRLFRKSLMVLQLEVKHTWYEPFNINQKEEVYFRDATVEDLVYTKGENK